MSDDPVLSGAVKRLRALKPAQFYLVAKAGNLAIDAVLADIRDVLDAVPSTQALEANRMREALEDIARQKTYAEFRAEIDMTEREPDADWIGGYDACVNTARAALHPEPSEGEKNVGH